MTGTRTVRNDSSRNAGALGHEDSPDGTDARNGSDTARVHAHVGPVSHPNRSETPADAHAHGANPSRAHTRVGPRLDGNTDTRGLVDGAERERLQPFGNEVRAMRKSAGLTQEQLGKLAGIGVTHISRLEHGRRRPSVDAIKALSRVLAPEGTTDAAEQHLARLAGDSLRTGAARRKRQRDNKHRRAALKEIERARRILNRPDPSLKQLLADEEEIAAHMRRELQEQEDPGIRGVTPIDDRGGRSRYALGRPKSRSLKDIQAWLDAHGVDPADDDDDEL